MLRLRKGEWVDKRLSHSLGRGSGTDSMKFFFNSLMLAWCFFISSWVLSRSYHQKDRVSEGTRRGLGLPKLCLAKLHSAELLPTSQTVLTLQTHKGSVRSPPLGLIGINCNHGTRDLLQERDMPLVHLKLCQTRWQLSWNLMDFPQMGFFKVTRLGLFGLFHLISLNCVGLLSFPSAGPNISRYQYN